MFREKFFSEIFESVLIVLVVLLSALTFWLAFSDQKVVTTIGAAGASSTVSSTLILTNAAPIINSVTINNGVGITTIGNATTAVSVNAQVFDVNGCDDINNATATILLYRSSITSSTCLTTQNNLNCYLATAFTATSTCVSGRTINTTTTFGAYYFAQATDASSSFPSDTWLATLNVRDTSLATATLDSSGVEMNTVVAIDTSTSSINYGSLNAVTSTGMANQVFSIKDVGNSSASVKVSGTAMSSISYSFATSSQHYSSSSFAIGGNEGVLSDTATTISGIILQPAVSLVNNIGSWVSNTTLPYKTTQQFTVSSGGYIYNIGGGDGVTPTSTVNFASTTSVGTINSWQAATPLLNKRMDHVAEITGGYVFVIGGHIIDGTTKTATVEYAPITATSSIGSWSTGTAMSEERTKHAGAAANGYLYVLAGYPGGSDTVATSSVIYSTVSSNGSNGAWSQTQALPAALYSAAAVINKGFIYVTGGVDPTPSATTTVFYAPINSSSGMVGSWITNSTTLPTGVYEHSLVVSGDYLYVVGGDSSNKVYYAKINSDGSVGTWSTGTNLPNINTTLGSAVVNGYLYILGGTVPPTVATSTVISSGINNGNNQRDTFWGLLLAQPVPGTYNGANTFIGNYAP